VGSPPRLSVGKPRLTMGPEPVGPARSSQSGVAEAGPEELSQFRVRRVAAWRLGAHLVSRHHTSAAGPDRRGASPRGRRPGSAGTRSSRRPRSAAGPPGRASRQGSCCPAPVRKTQRLPQALLLPGTPSRRRASSAGDAARPGGAPLAQAARKPGERGAPAPQAARAHASLGCEPRAASRQAQRPQSSQVDSFQEY
jgi:hypothetical protein